MDWLPTWMSSRHDTELVRSVLVALIGRRPVAVRYQIPVGATSSDYHVSPGIDQARMGVEIDMADDSTFMLAWHMDGYREGLRLGLFDVGSLQRHRRVDLIDSTDSEVWRACIGRDIEVVAASWFSGSSDEGAASTAVWSVRLGFDNRQSIVVALGEVPFGTDDLSYIPDNLVVISEPKKAQQYVLVDSIDSAWGSSI